MALLRPDGRLHCVRTLLLALCGAGVAYSAALCGSVVHDDPTMQAVPVLLCSAMAGAIGTVLALGLAARRREGARVAALVVYGVVTLSGYFAARLGPF